MSLLSSLLAGLSLGISLSILTHQPPQESAHLDIGLKLPSFATLFKLFPVILHALGLGSNSYTIWEDRVILHLISFSVFLPTLLGSFCAPQERLRNRLLMFSVLFGICVRLISLSTVCREEQHSECSVTFYANSTSSNAPNWAMSILIPLAIALPIVPAWFLGISDSYRGPASFYFGAVWRLILLCGAQYWITDYMLSHEGISLTGNLVDTGSWVKLLVARVAIGLCVFAGGILWFILPPCIDVTRVEEDKEQVGKPRLLVIGFANAYGSSYLMFLVASFGMLFLVTQPVGQVILSLGLVAILSLVEINDSLMDVKKLRESFQKAIEAAATPKDSIRKEEKQALERLKMQEHTDLNMIIALHFLGYLMFFGTGHQAAFVSIQWKTGFIGLRHAHHLFSAILISLNTFAGFILVALAIPLFKLWNLSPVINLNKPSSMPAAASKNTHAQQQEDTSKERSHENNNNNQLDSSILESQVKFLSIQAMIVGLNMLCVYYLRRHLMVWKIFSPRFLLSCSLILLFHSLFLSLSFLATWLLKRKISRTFGQQFSS